MSSGPQIGEVVIGLPPWTPYAAVFFSGLAGATYAARRGFDVIGVLGIAISTGLGGLLLRDVLLQRGTPVILTDPIYLEVAVATAVLGFFFAGLIARFKWTLIVLEGLSLGFLCTVGALPALREGLGAGSAIFLGVVTGVGGLVLRDLMAGEAPEILRPGIFVGVAALIGTVVFVGLIEQKANSVSAQIIAMAVVMILRILGEKRGWRTKSAIDITDRTWDFWQRGKRKSKKDNDVDLTNSTGGIGTK